LINNSSAKFILSFLPPEMAYSISIISDMGNRHPYLYVSLRVYLSSGLILVDEGSREPGACRKRREGDQSGMRI
jgi:hypothetical protein